MYILGLATMTESAAVLMRDGHLVVGAEEERFTRVKHEGGFPYHSVRFCLESAGVTLADIDHVAVYWDPYRLGHRVRLVLETLLGDPRRFLETARRAGQVFGGRGAPDSGWASLFATRGKLARHFGTRAPRVHFLDHHASHMASSFFGSGYDEAALLVMDGAGEEACTTSATGKGTTLATIDQHLLPHSLGHFYSAVTGYLGFRMLDGEYRLMGMSPYGDPSGSEWIRRNFLRTVGPGRYHLEPGVLGYIPALRGHFDGPFTDHFGPPRAVGRDVPFEDRHRDVAASAQHAFEEVVLDLARTLRTRSGLRRLCVSGGCGMNCVANGRIIAERIFDEIYVPPVPHDSGGALGAAMLLYTRLTGKRPEPLLHAQYGPSFDDEAIRASIATHRDVSAERLEEQDLCKRSAAALASGQVIGWFQGRMELGPRALGSRSFLADPRSPDVRDLMNEKMKKRELFRPFAPSVKAERAAEYFVLDQPAPFMSLAVPVRPEMRDVIPAVTHVNGSARPQTVERDLLPRYWTLLHQFELLTGHPVLLNTSFNIQEPIVCTPAEAIATFLNSGADALVLENWWLTRATADAAAIPAHENTDQRAVVPPLASAETPVSGVAGD